MTVFLLAALLHDRLFPPTPPPAAPEHFTAGGDARGSVRVLRGTAAPGVEAVLLTLREDGAATGPEEAILNEALFPGEPPRRWARLLVAAGEGAAPFDLDLGPGAIRLETDSGPADNLDLAAATAARTPLLPAHRLLDLRVARADAASVRVAPGSAVRVLVAFPPGGGPERSGWADLRAGGRLLPVSVTTESLRGALLAGRPSLLREAEAAEVGGLPSPSGGRGGGRGGSRR